jgi:hypothetical protein
MARSPRSITPTPSLLNDAMPTSDAIPTSESASTPGKNCYSRGICGHSCHRGRDLLFGLSVQLSICSGRKGLGSIGPHVGSDRRHRIRFRQSHEIILQRIKARGTSRFPFCSRSQSDGYKFRGSSPAGVQAPWFRSRGRESCPDSALVATVRQFAR